MTTSVYLYGVDNDRDPLWNRCEGFIFEAWRRLREQHPETEDALIYLRIQDGRTRVEVYDRTILDMVDARLKQSAYESLKGQDCAFLPSCVRDAVWVIIDNEDDNMHRVATIGWPTELAEGSQALS